MGMPTDGSICYIGLGSNLGDRAGNLRKALRALAETEGITLMECSSVYETEPVGVTDQPRFLNMVTRICCELSPHELLAQCQRIEQLLHRTPTKRWGPRTIDLDILLFGDISVSSDELTIPHPRMHERQFVLVPLAEIAADVVLATGERVGDMVEAGAAVRRILSEEETSA